jgi:hypothetical protein
MRRPIGSENSQIQDYMALRNSVSSDGHNTEIAQLGGIECIVATLRKHIASIVVLTNCFEDLLDLTCADAHKIETAKFGHQTLVVLKLLNPLKKLRGVCKLGALTSYFCVIFTLNYDTTTTPIINNLLTSLYFDFCQKLQKNDKKR